MDINLDFLLCSNSGQNTEVLYVRELACGLGMQRRCMCGPSLAPVLLQDGLSLGCILCFSIASWEIYPFLKRGVTHCPSLCGRLGVRNG